MNAWLHRVGSLVCAAAMGVAALSMAGTGSAEALVAGPTCSQPAQPHTISCFSIRQAPKNLKAFGESVGSGGAAHSGYGPDDLHSAYNLPTTGGANATVAIVDAYDDPTAESDLAVYRAFYNLPPCTTANGCFRKVNQSGATSGLPAADQGWAGEIALDLAMVSAVCPSCHLLLVEADQASGQLYTAVQTAVRLGAKYVSMSWGGAESADEQTIDRTVFNAPGVVFTAASGDSAYGVNYPAASGNVIAVGGTTLTRSGSPRGWSESVWYSGSGVGTGSGCSSVVAKPAWQSSVPAAACSRRAVVDVAADADPNSGVAVYQRFGASGWVVYGGTSAAAPMVAAMYALAGTAGSTTPAAYPYLHPTAFNQITTGSNGSCPSPTLCHAGPGWDGPTGLGSPNGLAGFTPAPTNPVTAPVATPVKSSSAACPSALANGNFQYGSSGWSASQGVIRMNTGLARSGRSAAQLGGVDAASGQSLSRAVVVPAGCRLVLTYAVRVASSDKSGRADDVLALTVNGRAAQTVSNLNRGGYVLRKVSLSAYGSGRTIIRWSTRPSSAATSFLIDDVSLAAG